MAFVGGVGKFWRPIAGTIILVAADGVMREFGGFSKLGFGLIIAAFIVLMPQGLVGRVSDLARWMDQRRLPVSSAKALD